MHEIDKKVADTSEIYAKLVRKERYRSRCYLNRLSGFTVYQEPA